MITIKELQRWLGTLDPENSVGIHDGGLALVEINGRTQTGAYYEVGGYGTETNPDYSKPDVDVGSDDDEVQV